MRASQADAFVALPDHEVQINRGTSLPGWVIHGKNGDTPSNDEMCFSARSCLCNCVKVFCAVFFPFNSKLKLRQSSYLENAKSFELVKLPV